MLLLLLACTATPEGKATDDSGPVVTDTFPTDDTGGTTDSGTVPTGDGPSPESITAEITPKVATVIRVRWTTSAGLGAVALAGAPAGPFQVVVTWEQPSRPSLYVGDTTPGRDPTVAGQYGDIDEGE